MNECHNFRIGNPSFDIMLLKQSIENITGRQMLNVTLIEDEKLIINLGDIISKSINIEVKPNNIIHRKYNKQEYVPYTKIKGEIWKTIDDYPEIEISNIGRIKYCNKIAKLKNNKQKYQIYSLKDKNGKRHTIRVHRLVAMAFIPNIYNKPEIDHINTKKDDNRSCNLRWVWAAENIIDNEITRKKFLKKSEYYKKVIYEAINRDIDYSTKNNLKLTYSENTNFWLKKLGIKKN